jgi:hypothetical protein
VIFFENSSKKSLHYELVFRLSLVQAGRVGLEFLLAMILQTRIGMLLMRTDQDAAYTERISLAYRRLANAMILSTLREISKGMEPDDSSCEIAFVESQRIDPWCELAGLEPEVVRRAARRLVGDKAC